MSQTAWVIKVLDEACNKPITKNNRNWLEKNISVLNIVVCVEDCHANVFQIAEEWGKDGNFVLQDGERIKFRADFNPTKEALLLIRGREHYWIFIYSPE